MKLTKVVKSSGRGLYGQFLTMTLLPLVVSGIVMILVASYSMKLNIQKEANENLQNVAHAVLTTYDVMYPGDYEAQLDGENVVLYKGDKMISDDFTFVDQVASKGELEISIVMMDTRLITTLKDDNGNRYDHTVVAKNIVSDVYEAVNSKFYNNVEIAGQNYYAYYEPIMDVTGSKCVGMIGVAKPASQIAQSVNRSVISNIVIVGLAMLVTGFFIVIFANQIILMIKYMLSFMKKLADNNLDAVMNERVTHRDDEIGVMGRMLVDLQISLRRLIERDVLTSLYNRRCAEKKIKAIEASGVKYCVSIGDIDHFKKFNDTFGHECGDVVLKEVAHILNDNMKGKGFVARWGGEEFLLVYEAMDIDSAYAALMGIRDDLHAKDIEYQENIHKVTMTFGVAEKLDGVEIEELIRMADDKLYDGKQGGRDRVIR